jgi:murein DD-endopeptidase MepM/ murein hydrolase activator NlpD
MKNKILLSALILFSSWAAASRLPDSLPVPGGLIQIPVGPVSAPKPKVFYDTHRVLVTQQNNQWLALVGIPLGTSPGQHQITIEDSKSKTSKTFTVAQKSYPAQYLEIKKKRMVTGFTEEDLKKINQDKIAMAKAKAVWSETNAITDFMAPVDGRLSSLFGLQRYFNNIPKKPHNGLDIAAPVGTPILAPAEGVVIDTGHYYFNGNTIFLDHGQGLLTAFLHMNRIDVKPGQVVKQGEALGTVGATGRVTGPHLHWIVYLNHTPVDPALFISADIPRLDARNKK